MCLLLKEFWPQVLIGGMWQISYTLVEFVNPQLLNQLIAFVEDPNAETWKGYVYVLGMTLATIYMAVASTMGLYTMDTLAIKVNTALCTSIYAKSMKLSTTGRKVQNAGECLTLLNVDAEKIHEAISYLNLLWSTPLQLGLSIYFIYMKLGWAVFVGKSSLSLFK